MLNVFIFTRMCLFVCFLNVLLVGNARESILYSAWATFVERLFY